MRSATSLRPARPDPGSQSSLRDIWSTVHRHRWLVLATTAATVVLVGVLTTVMRPRYDSVATLRIETNDPKGEMISRLMPMDDLGLPDLGSDETDTELGVMRSRIVTDAVAEDVGLHVHLSSPRTARGEVLEVLEAPRTAPKGRFVLRRRDDGSYAVRQTKGAPVSLPAHVRIGEPFEVGQVRLQLASAIRNDPPAQVRVTVRSFRETADDFRKDLRIKRDSPGSKLIGITYRSSDPDVSAAVVNGIAETYIRWKLDTSRTESRSTVDVLREQIDTYASDLRAAEQRLQTFQETQQVVAPREQADQQVRRMGHMQVRRDELSVERASLASLLDQVRSRPPAVGPESPYRRLATFPSFIHNRAIQDLLAHLVNVEGQRSLLLQRRTEVDPDVRAHTERIQDLEAQMHAVASAYLASLDNQIASATSVLGSFDADLERLPGNEAEYARLARDQKLISELYLMLQMRLREAEVQDAVDRGIVRMVDTGLVAEEPDFPKRSVSLILGAVLGLMLGLVGAFGRDLLDTTVRSPADAEDAAHGLTVLGAIPRIAGSRNGLRGGARWISIPGRKVIPPPAGRPDRRLVTRTEPWAPASEAYRALRTSIIFAAQESAMRLVVVTSALPGEGKSTNAANLAVSLAQQGTRVLLVDADMRRGALHTMMGAAAEPGLAQVLRGTATLDEVLQTVPGDDAGLPVNFLSSGGNPPNPAELLASPRMRDLAGVLRERFEIVVFDAPPLTMVTDAAVLGSVADSTVLVARNGITNRSALEHAVTQLRNLRVPVGGVVLNDFTDPERAGYALSYGPVAGTGADARI